LGGSHVNNEIFNVRIYNARLNAPVAKAYFVQGDEKGRREHGA
jgi:hypothetical protein